MSAPNSTVTNQYLTFRLGGETYALDVGNAREILEFPQITHIPNTPEWVRGVINLRGNVVPVLDLKLKFGMARTERTVNTCVVIIDLDYGDDTFILGILADSVQEVFEMDPKQIEPPPKMGHTLSSEYIRGLGRHKDQFFIILRVERVFSSQELAAMGRNVLSAAA